MIRTSSYDENYGTSTYSVRKEKKKTNVQTTDVNVENGTASENDDYRTLVDNFVHEVIERAKQEYLSGCANGGIDTRLCEERGDRLHDTGKLIRLTIFSCKNAQVGFYNNHQENMQCIPPYTQLLFSKTGVWRGIPIFLIFAPKHRLWVLVRTACIECFQLTR